MAQANPNVAALRDMVQANPTANGLAIIVSNDYTPLPDMESLTGTYADALLMKTTFEILKFGVLHKHNINKGAFLDLMNQTANFTCYPESYKRVAIVFSGHGANNYRLYMQDGNLIRMEDIFYPFFPERAPLIGSIPKLFFIDACRGEGDNPGVMVPRGGEEVIMSKVPQQSNFLVAYSTIPGYKSYEARGVGGIWLTKLAHELIKKDASVLDILTKVNKKMKKRYQKPGWGAFMQQPELVSRLNEGVYLLREARISSSSSPSLAAGHQSSNESDSEEDTSHESSSHGLPVAIGPRNTSGDWEIVSREDVPQYSSLPSSWQPGGGRFNFLKKLIPTLKRAKSHDVTDSMQTSASPDPQTSPSSLASSSPEQESVSKKPKSDATTPPKSSFKREAKSASLPPRQILYVTAKQKLEAFCREKGKPPPKYQYIKLEQSRRYEASVYVAQTCGWTKGGVKSTKAEAEEDAAATLLQKLHIYF